jgi:hypothetical protein
MTVTKQKNTTNEVQWISEWVLDLRTIPEFFLFREGHLTQSINLEKAEQPIRINCVELQESEQMMLSDWTGGC